MFSEVIKSWKIFIVFEIKFLNFWMVISTPEDKTVDFSQIQIFMTDTNGLVIKNYTLKNIK